MPQCTLYLNPAELQAIALSNTRISWKLSRILGKFVRRNPVTMATNIMAILSSAFLLLALLLVGEREEFDFDPLKEESLKMT